MHTPGPWTTEVLQELTTGGERMPASYISSSQGWANSGMAGKRTVAIVGHWKDRPNPEDDALLIAAAPELYREFIVSIERGFALGYSCEDQLELYKRIAGKEYKGD